MRDVVADAGLDVADEAVDAVVRQAAGSARDTLSALDQVVAAGGVVEAAEPLDEIVEALADRDTGPGPRRRSPPPSAPGATPARWPTNSWPSCATPSCR